MGRSVIEYPLLFQWGLSVLHGWGIYGLNLMRYWPKIANSPVFCGANLDHDGLRAMGPLDFWALKDQIAATDMLWPAVDPARGGTNYFNGVVLHSLGNGFRGAPTPKAGGTVGRLTCGVIFAEDTRLSDAVGISSQYAQMIAGSSWTEEVLRANGVTNVTTVLQGIDPSLFHPAPSAGMLDGRFVVFSGGKVEFRKGQDLVLLAFRDFAERHPEALLVTAWHSPWSHGIASIDTNPAIAPVSLTASGQVDVAKWGQDNGIDPARILDLGAVPNHLMGRVLREMDVAVFPNRCESGTNLVAMECMACGVPAIISDNTGHKDLVATGAPFALTRQSPVAASGTGTDGWGESDVDEIVAALETVWSDRETARRRGLAGADAMAGWSWRNQIRLLHETLAKL